MDTTPQGTCFVRRDHDGIRPHAESKKCRGWRPMPLQMPKVDRQGRAYESLTRAANDIGARGDELEKLLVRFDAAFWGTFCCECGILLSLPLCPSLGEECAPVHDLVIEAHLALECEHDRPRRDCGVCRIADPVNPAPVQACSTFAPDNNDGDCANCGEGLETHTDKETPA